MPRARDPLGKLRQIVLEWPETSERLSHGSPTFWGGRKTFASFHDDHHGDGRLAVWCKATHELQEELVRADSEIFFVPPYVGPSGWIGIRLDRDLDWDVLADLLERAYRLVAPARAVALLDGDRGGG